MQFNWQGQGYASYSTATAKLPWEGLTPDLKKIINNFMSFKAQ